MISQKDVVENTYYSCQLNDNRASTVHQMARMRKNAVQIRFEILEYLFFNNTPQLRTTVWRKSTNLSYDDFLKHLEYLKSKNLIKETEATACLLTEEGRKLYIELRKSLPSIL